MNRLGVVRAGPMKTSLRIHLLICTSPMQSTLDDLLVLVLHLASFPPFTPHGGAGYLYVILYTGRRLYARTSNFQISEI